MLLRRRVTECLADGREPRSGVQPTCSHLVLSDLELDLIASLRSGPGCDGLNEG